MKADITSIFEKKVKKTIRDNKLFTKKDLILVACSGGKDSTAALYIINKLGYKTEAIMIDLKMGEWSDNNVKNLKQFCKEHKIKLNIIDINQEFDGGILHIYSKIKDKIKISNCTICGVIRRWLLNKKARELDATKLVTGHNIDDEAENILMNLLKGNPALLINLGPKTGIIEDNKFVQRVKPLYFCTNDDVKKYADSMDWNLIYEPCPYSTGVFRREIRNRITELEKKYPDIRQNLVDKLLEILPTIQTEYTSSTNINYCEVCGEPSRGNICKRCKLLKIMIK